MKHESQVAEMNGAFSAIFTPFDAAGEIKFDMLEQIVEFQLEQGLNGFFVTGSTGEGLLLSESERTQVVRAVVGANAGRGKVVAHVGHPSSTVAARLADEAADAGADWISSVAPIYHGTTFDGALRHYRHIATATDLPFMMYALGAEIEPLRDQAFFKIPNLCGVKYTGANFFSVQQLVRLLDRPIALMSGFDEQFVAAQSFGFHGGIGSTFNFAPKFYAEIYRLYHEGKIQEAAAVQAEINQVTLLMGQYENWSYRKAIMRYIGFDCGASRAPYAPLSEQEYETFAKKLDQIDVLQPMANKQVVPTPKSSSHGSPAVAMKN